jgi:hypothetical protein
MICDACGIDMTPPEQGWTAPAVMSFTFNEAEDASVEMKAYNRRMIGRYEVNRTYNICWECLLGALGIMAPGGRSGYMQEHPEKTDMCRT